MIRQLERRTFRLLLRYSSYPTQIRFHVKASCTDRFKTFDGGLTINEKKKKLCARQKNFGASTDGETDDTRFIVSRKGEEVQTALEAKMTAVLRLFFISKSIV